jgi:hypothetical protein
MSQGAAVRPGRDRDGMPWLVGFLVYCFACQLLLLVPALSSLRLMWRTAAFAGSLALLFMLPGRSLVKHPARSAVVVVVVLLTIGAFNPQGAGPVAAVAHFAFYLAILGPLFWVARLRVDVRAFELLLVLFWAYYTTSAVFGLLQVYFPGEFQPPLSRVLAEHGPAYLDAMQIRLASGASVLRPMGLTDVPGGAALAGFYAALFGLGLIQAPAVFRGSRWLALVSVVIGVMVLYLSQVRSLVVTLGLATIALVALQGVSGRLSRLVAVGGVAASAAIVAYALAIDVGGATVSSRLETLTAAAPGNVYYTNRGVFLEHTFNELLPTYPLGGGLGRWGMMNHYFGSARSAIWVEIQWTGWLIDGGVLLVLAYSAAVFAGLYAAARQSLRGRNSRMALWAPLIGAHGLGVLAMTFNAAPFMSVGGLEFWLLNAAFVSAAATEAIK